MFPHFLFSRRWGFWKNASEKPSAHHSSTPSLSPGHLPYDPPTALNETQAALWNAFPFLCARKIKKKNPLTSELRLKQTELFREQLLPNFINTCINKSGKNGRGCLLWRRASYLSLYWQQIPCQLILRRYPETKENLGKFPLNFSHHKFLSEQPRKTAMLYTIHPCWKQTLAPKTTTELYPIFPDNSGEKIINLLPVPVPALLQRLLCSQLPRPQNVFHQLQLLVPPEAVVAALPSTCVVVGPGFWARKNLSKLWGYSKRKLYFLISSQ